MNYTNDRFKKGSRPPYISLSDALKLAEDIYEQSGGHASKDLVSRLTGNSSSSSSFTRKVNALKSYGLLVESNSEFDLTPNGVAIVAPTDDQAAAEAKKQVFLSIEPYAKIFERHKGKLLPADEFLKNIIEQDLRLPRELSGEWLASLKDALKASHLLHDRGDGKMQIMESPIVRFPRTAPPPVPTGVTVSSSLVAPVDAPERETRGEASTAVPFSASGHSTKIELSGHRYAVFCIPDSLTIRDAQKIKSAITGLGAIIESMVQEDGP